MSPIAIDARAEELFRYEIDKLQRLTNRVFTWLLPGQWAAAVVCAVVMSPLAWSGSEWTVHAHVLAATVIGGLLTLMPLWLFRVAPDHSITRQVAAISQLLFSSLLIHLMGGRIEAHFHVFGSLALLAFYRDYRVFIPAVVVTFVDHLLRGVLWPQSVFGVLTPSMWRAFEHAAWVLFESGFLTWGVAQSRAHLRDLSTLRASLEHERDQLEETVRQRTAEIAATRDYFENVINSLDAHVCILDADGVIRLTNDAWRAYGSTRSGEERVTGVGANYFEICRAATGPCRDSAVRLAERIEAMIRDGGDSFSMEYECHDPDRERWFQCRVSRFLDVGQAAAVVSHVDITDRVEATTACLEEALRAAALSRIIAESPNEVYIARRSDLGFELVNDGAVQATGFSREELTGLTTIDLYADLGERDFRLRVAPLDAKHSEMIDFQAEHRRKDGSTYPVRVAIHAAEYDGTPVYVAFVADLTEVQQLERRLAQAQKLESIGELAAGIAHEINTPMQCVAGNVEFLRECYARFADIIDSLVTSLESPPQPWETRRDALQQLMDDIRYRRFSENASGAIEDTASASRRVVEIVRAMKAMSHPGTPSKTPTDINDALRNAATISRSRWKQHAELELDLDETLPHVPTLPAELNQVFLNLIVNAGDAIGEKHADTGRLGKITLRTSAADGIVRIEVEDNGAGVPDAVRHKVFDPFFTTKEIGKGTGQGLAITHDVVVNKHCGTIDLLSTHGEGTTFVVTLPLEAVDANGSDDSLDWDAESETPVAGANG